MALPVVEEPTIEDPSVSLPGIPTAAELTVALNWKSDAEATVFVGDDRLFEEFEALRFDVGQSLYDGIDTALVTDSGTKIGLDSPAIGFDIRDGGGTVEVGGAPLLGRAGHRLGDVDRVALFVTGNVAVAPVSNRGLWSTTRRPRDPVRQSVRFQRFNPLAKCRSVVGLLVLVILPGVNQLVVNDSRKLLLAVCLVSIPFLWQL